MLPMISPVDKNHNITIDLREPLELETYFADTFAHNPYAEELNTIMAFDILARTTRTAYGIRGNPSWLLGIDSQGTYHRFVSKLHLAGVERRAGVVDPANTWHNLITTWEAREKPKDNPIPLEELVGYVGECAALQEKFVKEPTSLTYDELFSLSVFSRFVRDLCEEAVVQRIATPFLETDVPPPDTLIHPDLLREFTDVEYWKVDSPMVVGRQQRAKRAGSVVATQMIALHRILQTQEGASI